MTYASFISAAVVAVGLVVSVSGSAQAQNTYRPSQCTDSMGKVAFSKALLPLMAQSDMHRPKQIEIHKPGWFSGPKIVRRGCDYYINGRFTTWSVHNVKMFGTYEVVVTYHPTTGNWSTKILKFNQPGGPYLGPKGRERKAPDHNRMLDRMSPGNNPDFFQ